MPESLRRSSSRRVGRILSTRSNWIGNGKELHTIDEVAMVAVSVVPFASSSLTPFCRASTKGVIGLGPGGDAASDTSSPRAD